MEIVSEMDGTIVFNQEWQGQQIKNVTVWSNFPTTQAARQTMADGLRGTWATLLAPRQSNDWSLKSVTFVYNESLPIYSVEVPFSLGVLSGSLTGENLPSQIALLVSTKYVGPPPNRGRIYFSGFEESQNVDGIFTSAATIDAQDLVQTWIDGISGGTSEAFLRIARRNPDGTLGVTSPVETAIAQTVPATIRRRRRGVGA